MDKIELVKFADTSDNYKLLHKWCSQEFIYEWFEQRVLSYEEIVKKYQTKLRNGKQQLFLISYNDKLIGYTQIYKYEGTIYNELKNDNILYEYDIFIGDIDYLSKGIGTKIVKIINDYIYLNYSADGIVLRPFERNERAIKCYLKDNFKIITEYQDKDTVGNKEILAVLVNHRE